jgi:hypothetical protein
MGVLIIAGCVFVALLGLIPRTGPLSIIGDIMAILFSVVLPIGFGLILIVSALFGVVAVIRAFVSGLVARALKNKMRAILLQ